MPLIKNLNRTLRSLIIFALALAFLTSCEEPEKPKTVVVSGDSWAFLVCIHKSLETAFKTYGLKNAKTNDVCGITSRIGLRAENWLTSDYHTTTQTALKDPTARVLYLSLGGNDLINYWNKNLSSQDEQKLFLQIKQHIVDIIKIYQNLRPDIKILISGYDYPRFTADNKIPEYRQDYENMGRPIPFEINSMLLRFSKVIAQLADSKTVFYIQHYGLMQYYLGNQVTGLAPFTTLKPELISTPQDPTHSGGDVTMSGDPESYLSIGSVVDAFHLSHYGFDRLADHTVYEYLADWLSAP